MKKDTPISKIMTAQPISIETGKRLEVVIELFAKHHFRHVPVLKKGQLVGIISKSDVDRLSFSNFMPDEGDTDDTILDMFTIDQVMTRNPRCVDLNESIYNVATTLSKEEYHALPVIDKTHNDELVGIVTTTDVIRYMLAQFD